MVRSSHSKARSRSPRQVNTSATWQAASRWCRVINSPSVAFDSAGRPGKNCAVAISASRTQASSDQRASWSAAISAQGGGVG